MDELDRRRRHKWWGWGPEELAYDMLSRPKLWPFIRGTLQLPGDLSRTLPVPRETLRLPQRQEAAEFTRELLSRLRPDQLRFDDEDRLSHGFGRSYRDLVRLRAGRIERLPDMVLYPECHEDVEHALAAALRHDVVLIPFGGGTNIVGCVEPKDNRGRTTVTLDLRRMNRLLSIDGESMTADFEPGIFGPELEDELGKKGFSLGHFPDSFLYSTLGGWLATRSAGTQSNAYGKIEDMVIALQVATPQGTLRTRPLPAASNGPDLNRLIVGSEGILGIITRATMRVHATPEVEQYRLVLFRKFEDGFHALSDCVREGFMPSLSRLSDGMETQLMFAAKPTTSRLDSLLASPVKRLLQIRGYSQPAALIVAFEGPRQPAAQLQQGAMRVLHRNGGFDLGSGPGQSWKHSRYDLPLLRDYVMDYGVIVDTFETATSWSNVLPLYQTVGRVVRERCIEITGHPPYIGCHLSHLYATGTCVYFTLGVWGGAGSGPQQLIEKYWGIKQAVTSAILAAGGALSHHHAVGYEHQPWIEQELSPLGVASLRAIKQRLDPTAILNPGSLLSASSVSQHSDTPTRRS